MTNSRAKGARIEREAVNILKDELGDGYVVERNYRQSASGGADIELNGVFIEVKGGKQFQKAWFDQAKEQAGDGIPVTAWRQHGGGWRIFMELSWPEVAQIIRERAL